MKNKEIFEFKSALETLKDIKGKAFAFAVYKNLEILGKEIEIMNKVLTKTNEDYASYEAERTNLCVKFSDKNEDGSPVLIDTPDGKQVYSIPEIAREKFAAEFNALRATFATAIKQYDTDVREIEYFLEAESDLNSFKKVKIDELPDDITASTLNSIRHMLLED